MRESLAGRGADRRERIATVNRRDQVAQSLKELEAKQNGAPNLLPEAAIRMGITPPEPAGGQKDRETDAARDRQHTRDVDPSTARLKFMRPLARDQSVSPIFGRHSAPPSPRSARGRSRL